MQDDKLRNAIATVGSALGPSGGLLRVEPKTRLRFFIMGDFFLLKTPAVSIEKNLITGEHPKEMCSMLRDGG